MDDKVVRRQCLNCFSDRNFGAERAYNDLSRAMYFVLRIACVGALLAIAMVLFWFWATSVYFMSVSPDDILNKKGFGSTIAVLGYIGEAVAIGQFPPSSRPSPDLDAELLNTTAEHVLIFDPVYVSISPGLQDITIERSLAETLECPDGSGALNRFGCSLSSTVYDDFTGLTRQMLAVGADAVNGTGAVYVYTRAIEDDGTVGNFTLDSVLTHPDLAPGAEFGASIDFDYSWFDEQELYLAVGAPGNGSVFIFHRPDFESSWELELQASDTAANFAADVSIWVNGVRKTLAVSPSHVYASEPEVVAWFLEDDQVITGSFNGSFVSNGTAMALGNNYVVASNGYTTAVSEPAGEQEPWETISFEYSYADEYDDLNNFTVSIWAGYDFAVETYSGGAFIFGPVRGGVSFGQGCTNYFFDVCSGSYWGREILYTVGIDDDEPFDVDGTPFGSVVLSTRQGWLQLDAALYAWVLDLEVLLTIFITSLLALVLFVIFCCCVPFQLLNVFDVFGTKAKRLEAIRSGSEGPLLSRQDSMSPSYGGSSVAGSSLDYGAGGNNPPDYSYQYSSGPEII